VRGALWVTLVVLCATVTALTLQYFRTFSVLETESRHLVQTKVAGVLNLYSAGGTAAVVEFIKQRRMRPELRDSVYMLGGPDGEVVAGDLDRWPAIAQKPGWQVFNFPVRDNGALQERRVEAELLSLPSGYRLIVGHLADGREQLRSRYLEALAWSVVATVLIGLVLGWWISRRALGFVQRAAATGERFLAGRLDERLPVTGRGDEYDRLAEVVNACFAEVERMIASLRAATDGLAHDLKTPLTRMKARAELAMLRDTAVDPEFLFATTRDIDALLKLINDLLALARVESLTADALQPIDLAEIAREAIDLYDPVVEAADRELVTELAASPILGARPLLVQATCNLIDNALKHASGCRSIKIMTRSRDNVAELSVADTGAGIDPEDRDRATDRLVRLDASRSTEGSGLGLSIVAAVARAHGGILVLEDNAPGLLISIRLPLALTAAAALPPRPRSDDLSPSRRSGID
jgi:signal transduction histidine kinase